MWPFDYLVLNSDNLTIGTISSLLATGIFIVAAAFYTPLRSASSNIKKLFMLFIKNPRLTMQVEIGASLEPIHQRDLINKIMSSLKSMTGVIPNEGLGGIIQFRKNFGNFDVDVEIIPEPAFPVESSEEDMEDAEEDKYISLSIIFRTRNLKLRDFKDGVRKIQAFIFMEMNLAFNRKLKMDIDDKKESIVIDFDEFPTMLKFIKELNVDSLTAKDKDIDIILWANKIRVNGKMLDPSIEKIEKLIKSNLGA